MAFDDQTRRRLFKTVTACRNLLTEDFDEQLRSRFGIYAEEGKVLELDRLTALDDAGREIARLLRERIDHLAAGKGREALGEAVHRLRREQAFTVLNRFSAVRMAEERDLISQSVGAGMQSRGFRVFEQAAGGAALGDQYERYRVYLDCLFDELSLDLGVLFDRADAMGLLFPGEQALRDLFDELNHPDIASLWAEDETIGWIYQYYNDPEERKRMRKESAAPRNSRELAVRNQFFTPRYVVEFLTDNTLGRIWYEMTKGQTRLKEQCRYLVRRPVEIFLAEGETPPDTPDQEGLSQEELLKQPVDIPHRPLKDPREIRLLDPACGSMHFGLYAFDLYETIYEEAWDLEASNSDPRLLTSDFSSKEAFLREVPRLIIEHNIYGVDIDPRAVQIAALSLWLRAQKAWKDQGVRAADRPQVRRSNIVCAEPMPGSPEMLEDFVATLDPPLLGELVKTVFEKMQLAGEAGSLLKIEEEIRTAIESARKEWLMEQDDLLARKDSSQEAFFETAEQEVISALRDYAERADTGSYQRRLFADDAARGFAFIDLCRKRFDAVVMNPPFGNPTSKAQLYTRRTYTKAWTDIYGSFLMRFIECRPRPFVGAITSSLFLYTKPMRGLRAEWVASRSLQYLVELGGGILDAATVSTALTITSPEGVSPTLFADLIDDKTKEETLLKCVVNPASASQVTVSDVGKFGLIALQPFCYHMGAARMTLWEKPDRLDPTLATVTKGNQTFDDFRFQRLRWEPASRALREDWFGYEEGGDFQPFYSPTTMLYNWRADGNESRAFQIGKYGTDAQVKQSISWWWKSGITYPRVSSIGFGPRIMPRNNIFSGDSVSIFPSDEGVALPLLAFLCSTWAQELIYAFGRYRKIEVRATSNLPLSSQALDLNRDVLSEFARKGVDLVQRFEALIETSPLFVSPTWAQGPNASEGFGRESICLKLETLLDSIDTVVGRMLFANINVPRVATKRSDLVKRYIFRDGRKADNSVKDSIGHALGTTLGRWDIRFATGERQPPGLPDPFDPLPVCPPGMLQNADGLPAEPKDVPANYPLRITWPGILVDEENHPEDIVARVREALRVIWSDRADDFEAEACEILGVKAKPKENLDALRVYFRDPNGFFKDHLARYSKSRRKAPIYWPLSTESGSYTIWIYYHRLDSQALYTCVSEFIDPKREALGRDLEVLGRRIGTSGTTEERQQIDDLTTFLTELKTLRDRLLEVAGLPYRPNLNDGVQITAAPLWKCFRHGPWQKVLMDTWKELEKGKYDWAHLTLPIWPGRVVPLCAKNQSIAIAHGLEDLLWVPDLSGKKKDQLRPLKSPEDEIKELIKAGHDKKDVDRSANDVDVAETLGLRDHLWVERPAGTWRRRISPKEEMEAEVARLKGR